MIVAEEALDGVTSQRLSMPPSLRGGKNTLAVEGGEVL